MNHIPKNDCVLMNDHTLCNRFHSLPVLLLSLLAGGGVGGAGFFLLFSLSKALCIWLTREEMTVDSRLGSSCAFSLFCCFSSLPSHCVKASICRQSCAVRRIQRQDDSKNTGKQQCDMNRLSVTKGDFRTLSF